MTAKRYHQMAMEIADEADRLRQRGDESGYRTMMVEAAALEARAAEMTPPDMEPSRSVLFRSAATMALDGGDLDAALQSAQRGLDGQPPEEIKQELLAIMKAAFGHLHNQPNRGR